MFRLNTAEHKMRERGGLSAGLSSIVSMVFKVLLRTLGNTENIFYYSPPGN